MCGSLKFILVASHLNLLFFVFRTYNSLIYSHLSLFRNFEISVVSHLKCHLNRKAPTGKFQNHGTVKGGCVSSKNKFKARKIS